MMAIRNTTFARALLGLVMIAAGGSEAHAQDPQLTQFYAAATHLNPAFAGGTLENRVSFHYRNQWPGMPGRFVSYGASYDVFIPKINSGIGVVFSSDEAGTGALGSSSFGFQYSYEVPLGERLSFRPGLQLGWSSRGLLNWNDLVFGDQINRGTAGSGATGSLEGLQNFQLVRNYFDVAAGGVIYSKRMWLGMSSRHLNSPSESLTDATTAPVPIWFSAHGGVRIPVDGGPTGADQDLLFVASYRSQGTFDQMDFGFSMDSPFLTYGISYRQILMKSAPDGAPNHDAISLLLGLTEENFRVGYSYDITVSTLGWGITDGAHEITLSYVWRTPSHLRTRPHRILPCAEF